MATLTVGTGSGFEYSTIAAAIAASADGDVIEVQAGTYTNDFATITTNITIEGVGGMVNMVATEPPPNLQGILTIGSPGATGPTVTLDNMSFSGAAVPDSDGGNGAGIRYKSGNLTLNNTYFYNNQDGLLGDADPTGTITINNSEFSGNGSGTGSTHNLYVGAIQQLTIDNSYFTGPVVGHDIKSRAANTTIENSRIEDPSGSGSYEIDLPNGGNAIIKNNVIEKGSGAQNSNFIAYGEEGNLYASSSLSITGNTVENDHGSANFVYNATTIPVSITGNTTYGLTSGQISTGPVATPEDNTFNAQSSEPALDTSAAYLPVIPFSFACFVAGTRINTADGWTPVEALAVGQAVITAGPSGDTPRRIRWIGHRGIDLKRHRDPLNAAPVRIRRGAFADGVPMRDLLVSGDHAIHIDGMLIPARLLRNGCTILRDERVRRVRYFHVELDRHAIILAEGLPAESYLDTGNRDVFENAGVPPRPHPDMASDDGQMRRTLFSCAPFVTEPEQVEPVWRQLADRASDLGYAVSKPATTDEPAVSLLIDGTRVPPVGSEADCLTFILPAAAGRIRLVSRSDSPAEVAPWIEDRRRLGVAVDCLVLHGPDGVETIPADHPDLTDGWHPAECEGARLWRWTDGDAAVPAPSGGAILRVHLAGKTRYRQMAPADSRQSSLAALSSA